MKFDVVNKSTILNRFVLHTLQRNITHLAVITRKTNRTLGILKGGNWQGASALFPPPPPHQQNYTSEVLFTLSKCYKNWHAN